MRDVGYALAGLGLFLTGLLQLAHYLQLLAGPRIRAVLARLAGGPVSAGGCGVLLGVLTQSTSAAAFVCIGLLNAGSLRFSAALSLSAWASVGTSVLVFLAAIDVLLVGLFVIGAVGLAHLMNLERLVLGQRLLGPAFASGALFTGLGLIKEGGRLLQASPWTLEFFQFAGEVALIAFLVGMIVTLIVQSSATVSILAVTLNVAGVLPLDQAVLLVCGSSIGSGLSVVMVTSHLEGVPRRLAVWQSLVKVIGVVIVMPILWLSGGAESLQSASLFAALDVPALVALLYLVLQVAGAVGASLLRSPLNRMLERWVPEPEASSRFAPRYIDYTDAARNLETALDLARLEQLQVIKELPAALDPLRPHETAGAVSLSDEERRSAALALLARIDEFVEAALANGPSGDRLPAVFALQSRSEALRALQEALHGYVAALLDRTEVDLGHAMTESLHLILVVLVEYVCDEQHDDDLLRELTADRSAMMEGIRAGLFDASANPAASAPDAWAQDRQALVLATGIFERVVWLVRQVAFADR